MWKMPFAKTPKIIQIETTIACNATCWFCPQKHATRKPMFMEEKNWKKIIDETRDLGMIYRPFILNEPFVDKRMEKIIEYAIETAHSRFPVIGDDKDDVIGILLAKDLLRYYQNNDNFDLRENLRPAVFIPESKRLNVLLEDFRKNRNHIAIVVDEYGGVAGLVTIEDVLEQIVGDIEDEFGFDETEANIVLDGNGNYRVKAYTDLTDINEELGTNFSTEDFDTIGGLVLAHVGRLPKGGEEFQIGGLKIKIIRADSRKLQILMIAKPDMNVEKTQ